MQSGNDKQPSANQKIVDFIQRNRRPIFVCAIAVGAALIVSVAALIIVDLSRTRAIAAVELLVERFQDLRGFGDFEDADPEDLEALGADLSAFARGRSGYAGARAWMMLGSLHAAAEEWAEAEEAWLQSARAAGNSYMAPVALFSAGAAAEEQGRQEEAIGHYLASISSPAGFFAAARAQFSVARILETQGDFPAAIEAYNEVIFGWPNDTAWGNLARSRIIALETRGSRLAEPVLRPDPVDFGSDFNWDDWDFDWDDWDFDFDEEDAG